MADFQFEIPKTESSKPEEVLIAAHEILPQSTDRLQGHNDGRVFFEDVYVPDAYVPLNSMDLPGWTHQPREPGLPLRTCVEQYTPPNAPPPVDGVQQVSMFFNGLPSGTDKDTAATLRHIFTDPKIDDTKTPYFIHNVSNIQGALAVDQGIPEDFAIGSAWTKTINNKRILFVEGTYLTGTKSDFSESAKALTAYIDADPQHPGQMLVTASYVASKELFDKYLPQAKRAFESMRFNNKTQEADE